ncbi:MAG: AMIN domain-containing protein [Candidatus Angelobacter sp.]
MKRILIFASLCGCLLLLHFSAQAKDVPTVRHVDVLSSGSHLEIEITTSEPLTPRTQVITGPDRLIVDFPGALPDARLHNLAVNRGEVKGVRIGLFSQNPPTTRVVFDLKNALQYQIFPSGRTLIVKLGASLPADVRSEARSNSRLNSGSAAVLKQVSAKGIGMVTGGTVTPLPTTVARPTPTEASDVRVEFRDGKLSIWADKATLASVLYEIQRRTGAEVSIPPSASQEKIVADIPPSPAREAIAALLDGSNFDFILIGSDKDPQALHSIILTTRGQDSASDQPFFPAVQSPPESNPEPDGRSDLPSGPPPDVQSTPEPQPDMVPQPQPENQDSQN